MKKKTLMVFLVFISALTLVQAADGFRGFGRGFKGSNQHASQGSAQYQELLSAYPALAKTISELEARNAQIAHVEVGSTSTGESLIKIEAREGAGVFDYLVNPSNGEVLGRYAD